MTYSVVVPAYNEEATVRTLYEAVRGVMNELGEAGEPQWELIFIDDGSTDGTQARLREIRREDARVKIIAFRRQFGQTAGWSAGFDHAQGDIVIVLDADLQNDPRDIPAMLRKMDEEQFDVISGWRKERKDNSTLKVGSLFGNWLHRAVTGEKIHDHGCSLKIYRREALRDLELYGEMHRFVPALASWIGVKVTEVPVNHFARQRGRSKYGLGRTIRVMLDLLTVKFLLSYGTRPVQLFGLVGLIFLAAGMAFGLYLSFLKLVLGQGIGNRPLLFLVVLLVVVGVQLIIMGLLGELMIRVYHETQGKPTYVVREYLGPESSGTL